MYTYLEYVKSLSAALVLPLDSEGGLTDISGNGRNGTATGGLVVGGAAEGPTYRVDRDKGATNFDGVNDLVDTTYGTRRNHVTNPSFETNTSGYGVAGSSRVNVCVNPSFETNITGVQNSTCTTAQSSVQAYDGTSSCQVTSTGAGAAPNANATQGNVAVAGTAYTFSAYVFHTVAGRTGRADLRFYDSGGALIGSLSAGSNVALTQNAWTRVSVTATAPASTAFVGWIVRCDVTSAGSSGEVSYIDALLIEATSTLNFYFPTVAQLAGDGANWTGTAHASSSGLAAYYNRVSGGLSGGSYSARVKTNGTNSGINFVSSGSSLTASKTYTGSVYVKALPGSEGRTIRLYITERTSGGATVGSSASADVVLDGSIQRLSVTRTFGATGVDFWLYPTCPDVGYRAEFDVDGFMLEEAAAVGTYFPTETQLVNGQAGWTGTAHASKSDFGCFANGTTRTFMGWAWRDTSSSADALLGTDVSPGVILRLSSGADQFQFFPTSIGATTTWAWPGNAQWVHWALVFNETSDAASLYVDGSLVSTQTNASQYAAGGNVRIGTQTGTSEPFDGRMAWVSVHERALTAAEIENAYNIAVGEYWNMLTDSPNYTNNLVIDPGTNSLTIKGL